jgi:hypothetical protein
MKKSLSRDRTRGALIFSMVRGECNKIRKLLQKNAVNPAPKKNRFESK